MKHRFGGDVQLYRIKILLNNLVEYAYPHSPKQKAYKAFYVEYIDKEFKSKHGDYNTKNKHIRIFNLSRTEDQLVVTSVHELAHHINFVNDTSHSFEPHGREFYKVYKKLLFTALDMGLFNKWQFINATADASDSRKVKRMLEEYRPHPINYKQDVKLIQVFYAYEIRKNLQKHGYKYNSVLKSWEKETENALDETAFLDSMEADYKVVDARSVSLKKLKG